MPRHAQMSRHRSERHRREGVIVDEPVVEALLDRLGRLTVKRRDRLQSHALVDRCGESIGGAWLTLPADKVQVFSDRVVIPLQDGGRGNDGPEDETMVDPVGISVTSVLRGLSQPVRKDTITRIRSGQRVNLLFSVSPGGVRVTGPSLLELSVSTSTIFEFAGRGRGRSSRRH